MKRLIGVVAAILLTAGFLGSYFIEKGQYWEWTIWLMAAAILVSMSLGWYWYRILRDIDLSIEPSIEGSIGIASELAWLQGFRPKIGILDARSIDRRSIAKHTIARYASSYVVALCLMAIGLMVMIAIDPYSGSGVYGALLKSNFGRGVATSFLMYMLLSSSAFLFVGIFAKLFSGSNE